MGFLEQHAHSLAVQILKLLDSVLIVHGDSIELSGGECNRNSPQVVTT